MRNGMLCLLIAAAVTATAMVSLVSCVHPRQMAKRSLPHTGRGEVYAPKALRSDGVTPGRFMHSAEPRRRGRWHTEAYDYVEEKEFLNPLDHPLSTFSIDVDTASFANVRRFLRNGQLPPAGAVRIEEMVNYFAYRYEPPAESDGPFSTHLEAGRCPWAPEHRLVRIGLKGRELADEDRPAMNLVFLLDVSGSMRSPNKLPLVVRSMETLLKELDERDRVAIAVYAGAEGVVLESTRCTRWNKSHRILPALRALQAGGSTNGGAGIDLAYRVALENHLAEGVNRVVLCTDGDFNVGVTDQGSLVRMVRDRARQGTFLTVLGYGMGNYKDSTLEKLADKGNGNYGYIDTEREAVKMLSEQLLGTVVPIAKDVKIQVEFNPVRVEAYRLIGYENRLLGKQDFNDDTKDAGEIGAGHTVTALYEVVPAGVEAPTNSVEPLRYQEPGRPAASAPSDETLTLKLRYKQPDGNTSKLLTFPFRAPEARAEGSEDFRFASAVAAFGMLLRNSEHAGSYTFAAVEELASSSMGPDPHGHRGEFLEMVRAARRINGM